ncbi:MAG: hypothetical protein WC273_11555 [Dehalococcoidia bacterium]
MNTGRQAGGDEGAVPQALSPRRYMIGIFDDSGAAEAATGEIAASGVSQPEILLCIAPEAIDAHGQLHGPFAALKKRVQALVADDDHLLERYEEAARTGACVIGVLAPEPASRDGIRQILQRHGGHTINFFGDWVIETLDADPGRS